jgi:hypothetical protein
MPEQPTPLREALRAELVEVARGVIEHCQVCEHDYGLIDALLESMTRACALAEQIPADIALLVDEQQRVEEEILRVRRGRARAVDAAFLAHAPLGTVG